MFLSLQELGDESGRSPGGNARIDAEDRKKRREYEQHSVQNREIPLPPPLDLRLRLVIVLL